MNAPILQPVAALVLWSLVMWIWLYATRIPALIKAGGKLDNTRTNAEFAQMMPPKVRWVGDNYNHLMEQPTIFYATAFAAALAGAGDGLNATLAWAYVALRVVHSLVHATVNVIMVRFSIFTLSSIVLAILAIRAALAVF